MRSRLPYRAAIAALCLASAAAALVPRVSVAAPPDAVRVTAGASFEVPGGPPPALAATLDLEGAGRKAVVCAIGAVIVMGALFVTAAPLAAVLGAIGGTGLGFGCS